MAAVSSPETWSMIRMTQGNESPASLGVTRAEAPAKSRTAEPSSRQLDQAPRDRQTISPEVGRQAKEAVSRPANPQKELSQDKDVMAQIRLVSVKGAASPMHTPNAESERITQTIAQKMRTGQDMDTLQRNLTKDDFGRDYGT
jgi:hemolysin activation/secretion protein